MLGTLGWAKNDLAKSDRGPALRSFCCHRETTQGHQHLCCRCACRVLWQPRQEALLHRGGWGGLQGGGHKEPVLGEESPTAGAGDQPETCACCMGGEWGLRRPLPVVITHHSNYMTASLGAVVTVLSYFTVYKHHPRLSLAQLWAPAPISQVPEPLSEGRASHPFRDPVGRVSVQGPTCGQDWPECSPRSPALGNPLATMVAGPVNSERFLQGQAQTL